MHIYTNIYYTKHQIQDKFGIIIFEIINVNEKRDIYCVN